MAMEIWKDPNGHTVSVDPSKWNADELKERAALGWAKHVEVKPAPDAPTAPKAEK